MMNYYRTFTYYFSNTLFLRSIGIALVLFTLGLFLNYYAGTYATQIESHPVTDIILSNTSPHDVDGIFIYGSFALAFFIFWNGFSRLQTLPFVLDSIALFVAIRSVFITLTHIGPFPSQITIHSDILARMSFGGDLFFSGHTGLPFLMALMYWRQPLVRNIFLVTSCVFAVIVLMGHLHYSIDVLSAYFITYSIYHIALKAFPNAHQMFTEGLASPPPEKQM